MINFLPIFHSIIELVFANIVFMKRDAIVVAVGSLVVNGVAIGIEGVDNANYLGKEIWLSFLI